MKNIKSSSVLIRDAKGSILFLIDRNKIEFNERVKISDEEYYHIGHSINIGESVRIISDIQFIYRTRMGDFQTIITVD
ncbi:MAG: hypothetical protein ACHQK8_02635 [Bacteroidia bacterium]